MGVDACGVQSLLEAGPQPLLQGATRAPSLAEITDARSCSAVRATNDRAPSCRSSARPHVVRAIAGGATRNRLLLSGEVNPDWRLGT
jgi:hypothetical protein